MQNQSIVSPSARAAIITRRTYNRPLSDGSFETWEQTVDRVISHQNWLWCRAKGTKKLTPSEVAEIEELRGLMLSRKVLMAGRTLWLGGTEISRRRESSMFNCSFTQAETVYDIVDILWLLLQGCGVGFRPVVGTLSGFAAPIPDIQVVRSTRTAKGGNESNVETWDPESKVWTIQVGDSAEAWAKSIGKLVAGKFSAKQLVLDFSQIRPAGQRLAGYGWISSGDADISRAYVSIAEIMNRRAGSLLTKIDILDIVNWLGTILSSRRSAEICLVEYGDPEWKEFATAKRDMFITGRAHRQQSNNSLLFYKKPSKAELTHIFEMMVAAGGSEPGFINAEAALKRAPWFKGANPCVEILLGNKTFCNLVETDLGKFRGDSYGLRRAVWIASRAAYRQTCVDLRDGILQEAWHLNNGFLRLCGVSLTGMIRRSDLSTYELTQLERDATAAAYGMAHELGLPYPKNVTTNKPSGTLAKIMDTTEGNHKPLGKYILNNVTFSKHDELVPILTEAGYRVRPKPNEGESVIITLPTAYEDVPFEMVGGREVNAETAVSQLERYRALMGSWCQQNVSQTIYYSPEEVSQIVDWLDENWDNYVGVSFLFRSDPTLTEQEACAKLGYPYLPQEVVTKEVYEGYVKGLRPVNLDAVRGDDGNVKHDKDCASGACPVK